LYSQPVHKDRSAVIEAAQLLSQGLGKDRLSGSLTAGLAAERVDVRLVLLLHDDAQHELERSQRREFHVSSKQDVQDGNDVKVVYCEADLQAGEGR
jgi:hypothetical protein